MVALEFSEEPDYGLNLPQGRNPTVLEAETFICGVC